MTNTFLFSLSTAALTLVGSRTRSALCRGIGRMSVDLLLRESGGGLLRRCVRSRRIEARRRFCSFRNLWPEEVITDRLPQPPYPVRVVGNSLKWTRLDWRVLY